MEKKKQPSRGGRPSRAQAALLQDKILTTAADLFFSEGYGAASIDEIARRAGIAKRTFYSRFADKAAVFRAVTAHVIERLRQSSPVPSFKDKSPEEILRQLARLILRAALSRESLALHRILIAEATRFPELALIMDEQGARQEAISYIAAHLKSETEARRLAVEDTVFAAEQFIHAIVGIPQRRALGLGKPLKPSELDAWADQAVGLFIKGCGNGGR